MCERNLSASFLDCGCSSLLAAIAVAALCGACVADLGPPTTERGLASTVERVEPCRNESGEPSDNGTP